MNKSELLENYTAEQLAEMVVKYKNASEVKNDEIQKLKWKISNLEEENGRLQAKLDTYNEYLLPRCTKEARELIDGNHFVGVMIVSCGEWNNRVKEKGEKVILPKEYENYIREVLNIETSEIKDDCLRFSIEGLRRYLEIEEPKKQYETEKSKQRIVNLEKDPKTATEKIADLANENMKLQCERNAYESKAKALEVERMRVRLNEFSDLLPTEPIKVADMLISAEGEYERHPIAKAICGTDKGTYRIFDVADLRQIAEHLLVYCNANGEAEE